MEFYSKLEEYKKRYKLKYTDLGTVLSMSPDAFRMAQKRKSFSELEKKEIEQYFDLLDQKNAKPIEIIDSKEQIANKNGNVYEELGDGKYKIYVKKVPVKAFGSYLSHYQDSEFFDELKHVSFTVSHVGRGKYICFEVMGSSMNGGKIDDSKDGAELLCRELGRQHWKDGFKHNPLGWVIVHKDTILFKDIKSVDMETGDMVLSSRSGLPQHPEFTVNLNDVRQIWKVITRTQS